MEQCTCRSSTSWKHGKINNAIARLEALIESASEANVDKVDMAVNKAIEQSGKVRFSAQELQQIEDANAKFNEELIDFGEKKHVGLLHLGKPMKILQVSGVNVEEMTISPSVLYKHLKQHNLVTDDLLDLARAVQFPILVYKHGESHPNIVVVTELDVKGGKLSIALKLDENGEVVEVSNVSSVHSKDALTELSRLSLLEDDVLRNNLRWVEKEKVSDWLGLPYEEERQANPKLDSVAKIINEFKNPTIPEEKNEENSAKAQYSLQGNSMTEEEQRIVDEAKANGTFDASNPDIRYSLATDMARDAVMTALEGAGIDVEMATPEMVEDVLRARDGVQLSKRSEEREQTNRWIDEATAFVSGKSIKEVRQERIRNERERKELAKEIYENVLSGNFNDVTLQKINQYIDETTPRNPYGRRLSQRLPQRVEREMYESQRENAVDALYSRISESSVPANGRFSESGRREIESRKKEALKGWAIATGNWHTDLSAFTTQTEPIGVGTDSKVYVSKDGKHVIKASKGKPYGKRFCPDIDNIPLFKNVCMVCADER